MPGSEVETLLYAAKLLGGETELARRLGVTRAELDLWLRGAASPPFNVLREAIDIVTEASIVGLSLGLQ